MVNVIDDDDDAYDEVMTPSKTQKMSSNGSGSSIEGTMTEGPLNVYFSQKITTKGRL